MIIYFIKFTTTTRDFSILHEKTSTNTPYYFTYDDNNNNN
jgi:hypothetical protein